MGQQGIGGIRGLLGGVGVSGGLENCQGELVGCQGCIGS